MKVQKFMSWDEFVPDDWLPLDNEQYFSLSTEEGIWAHFCYDEDALQYKGEVSQRIDYLLNKENKRWFLDTYNDILNQLIRWGVVPERVSWVYNPNWYTSYDKFSSYLHELIDPRPYMAYFACIDDENCFVDNKYRIIHEGNIIYLHWDQYIYNDNTKPINIWNKTIELAKKRVNTPFRARVSTPDEDEKEENKRCKLE